MKCRDFVKSMAAVGALSLTGCGSGDQPPLHRPADPRAAELLEEWLEQDMPGEVRRALPDTYKPVQEAARQQYLRFVGIRDDLDPDHLPADLAFNFGLDRIPR